jgi:hypothetical protein
MRGVELGKILGLYCKGRVRDWDNIFEESAWESGGIKKIQGLRVSLNEGKLERNTKD